MTPELPPADLMTDRRKHTRRLAVKELIGLELGATNRGIVVDLSESGMRVQAAERVHLLPSSLVRFQIPGCGQAVVASCEVAWADNFGKAGLRFTGFSDNSLHELRRWLHTTTAPVVVEKRDEVRAVRPLPLPIPKPQVVTGTSPRPAVPLSVRTTGETPVVMQAGKVDSLEARLQAAAQNLMKLTSAEGAAVALRSGEQIVCRASVGTAPPRGAAVAESGLSGECLRQRTVVWCRDTDSDPRVNREACQRLHLRSTVLVPVLRQGNLEGLLEVFSSRPDIFDQGDVAAMTRMAEVIAEMLSRPDGKSGEEPGGPAAKREAALRLPQPVNGILRCDACGHPNPERAQVCESCDVPLRVPELEALLERDPKVSKLLLAAFLVLAPLGCFYAGHETGVLMQKKPAVPQTQPAKTVVVRPEVARQM